MSFVHSIFICVCLTIFNCTSSNISISTHTNSSRLQNGTIPTPIQPGSEKLLYRYLLNDYETGVRPVIDPKSTIFIDLAVKLNQILDLNERIQVLTSIVAVDQSWKDEYLQWQPEHFGGIQKIYIPSNKIWLPDIEVYNSVQDIHVKSYMSSHASVSFTGEVLWFPLAKLQTSCKLDIRYYPFDEQNCFIKIGSWSYSVHEVDVRDSGLTGVEPGDFVDNGEFELVNFTVSRVANEYDCCPDPIMTLNVNIKFRRRPMFAMLSIAIPCIMLSLMTIIAFILPPQNDEKIEIQLSVMLSFAVFMLMIGENLPPSDRMPLIGVHIVIQMGVTALSLVGSVVVLRIVNTDYIDVPENIQRKMVRLARLIGVGVPDYLKEDANIKGKLAILEKHQRDLRKTYLTSTECDGLSDKPPSLKTGLTKLLNEATKLHVEECSEFLPLTQQDAPLEQKSISTLPLPQNNSSTGTTFRLSSNSEPSQQSKQISILIKSVSKILLHLEDGVLKEQRQAEWRLLGALIDRILLCVLISIAVITTVFIYAIIPFQARDDND